MDRRPFAGTGPRMENSYLIVGLGNPGTEYARTRHNAGFLVVERLAERWQAKWTRHRRFAARVAKAERDGRRLMLCQPQTYMNQSGVAVAGLREYFRTPLERLLVVVDDSAVRACIMEDGIMEDGLREGGYRNAWPRTDSDECHTNSD